MIDAGGRLLRLSLSAASVLLVVLCAARAATAETKYCELLLEGVTARGKDLTLVIGVEDGQVRQGGLEVVGEPNTACRVQKQELQVQQGRLSGPLTIEIGPHTEKVSLDVALDRGGTYQVAYGCPEPSREVEGKITIEPPKDEKGAKWQLWLEELFGPESRLGITLEAERAAKTLAVAAVVSPGYNHGRHRLDLAKLGFDGTRIEGEVAMTVMPARRGRDFYSNYVGVLAGEWFPPHAKPIEATLRIKAALDGQQRTGAYSAVLGIERQRPGKVTAKPASAARMRELTSPLLSAQTPWRAWLATGKRTIVGEGGTVAVALRHEETAPLSAESGQLSPLPPSDWAARGFDDRLWGRYGDDLADFIGGFGGSADEGPDGSRWPALLCLRSRFGIADPAAAKDVSVTVEYLGGAAVYVNGVEVARQHLPAGALSPHTPAEKYPIEAYTTEDGATPLPPVTFAFEPPENWLSRYQARIRTLEITVPPRVLVKGGNVLAVELHAAPAAGPPGRIWRHVGVRQIKVTSASGQGTIAYPESLRGTHLFSAEALEQATQRPAPRALSARNFFHDVGVRGMPQKGIAAGNPFDPLVPVRILVPRGGVGSGQAVLFDAAGLQDITASVADFRGPGKAVLTAKAVRVRFGVQPPDFHWCDALWDQPPNGATTVPVWLEVNVPRDQTPGWYESTLKLQANGKAFETRVQVFVTGFAVPPAKNFRTLVGVMHSPDALVDAYGVEPWSDEHFKLMGRSLEMAGQLGNDVMYVPVILGTHLNYRAGLIRWLKDEKGLRPDFSLFEKYLDLYLRHCAPPRAISFYVWSPETSREVAQAYERGAVPSRSQLQTKPLRVTAWDPGSGTMSEMAAPDFVDAGAEAFWKPMLDGLHAIVRKRGWSERVIMLGCGSDIRPSQKTGELFRQWAPYTRWNIYSHFSGDPGVGGSKSWSGVSVAFSAPGKQIAIGNLEVGLKESPHGGLLSAAALAKYNAEGYDFLNMPIHRCVYNERTPPVVFRSAPCHNGRLARVGLDFWSGGGFGLIWGHYPTQLARRGPDGPVPSVRLQMMREGMQDYEARLTILEALPKLPPEEQARYRTLLDELLRRAAVGEAYLAQTELGLDWSDYAARLYRAAEEVSGIKSDARWDRPPQ